MSDSPTDDAIDRLSVETLVRMLHKCILYQSDSQGSKCRGNAQSLPVVQEDNSDIFKHKKA